MEEWEEGPAVAEAEWGRGIVVMMAEWREGPAMAVEEEEEEGPPIGSSDLGPAIGARTVR